MSLTFFEMNNFCCEKGFLIPVIVVVLLFALCFQTSPLMLCARGATMLESGDASRALMFFDRALVFDSDNSDALAGRAMVYYVQIRLDLAAADLEKAIELGNHDEYTFITLANIYAAWGEVDRAQDLLSEGKHLVKNNPLMLDYEPVPYQLCIGGPAITDLSQLARWNMIQDLRIGGAINLTDFEPLKQLSGLKSLELVECGLTDKTFLGDLKGLEVLYLNDNKITDISPLEKLTNLKQLELSGNPVLTDDSSLHNYYT